MEEPERRIGKYVLVREIGRGGMASVFEAVDSTLNRRVALKILRADESHPHLVTRLHREAAIAAQLRHPNIVAVHDVGVEGETHFIAMALIDGRTLAELMAAGHTPLPELLRLLEDVARAVDHAHRQGVVHRDLKPANVLVDRDGRALLVDFGLARAEGFASKLTRSNAVVGTPQYMSPEQAEGRTREIDARTDVYALGVILYEMLARRPPFSIETPARLYAEILRGDPPPPPGDPDLRFVCLTAMAREPARRYASAADFAEDLARVRRGESILARQPSLLYRLTKNMARRRGLIAAAAVALTLAVAVGLVLNAKFHSGRLRRALEEARREDSREAWGRVLEIDRENAEASEGLARSERAVSARETQRLEEKRRSEARDRAYVLLEKGRPALDEAVRYLYSRDARYDELVRRVDEAQALLEQALEIAPGLALGHYHLGRAWEIKGWDDKAEACWRKALDLDPEFGPAHYRLGRLLLTKTFLASMITPMQFQRGDAWRRESERLSLQAAGELERAAGRTATDDDLERELSVAILAYARRDLTSSLRLAEAAIEKFGGRQGVEEFHWVAGLSSKGRDAVNRFDRAIQLRPKFPLALFSRGGARMELGDLDGAISDFSEALQISPRWGKAINNRGLARYWKGDLRGAIADWTETMKVAPDFVEAYINRACARLKAGDREGCIADCTHALELDEQSAEAYNNRGNAYRESRDFDRAISDYTAAVGLNPKYAEALYNRGLAFQGKGDLDAALQAYSQAIDVNPRFAEAWSERGSIRKLKGDLDGALADQDEAIRLQPRFARAHSNRGILHVERGELDEAISDYDRAIDLDPNYPEPYVNRGSVREALGDIRGAVADYEKCLEVAPAQWPHRAATESYLKRARRKR